MRVAPVSGDLLVKVALLAIGIGVAVYAVRRVTTAASDAAAAVWAPIDAAQQWVRDQTNYVSDTAGGVARWISNEIHFENHPEYEFMGPPNPYESSYSGYYTSVTPPITGTGGAAFGIYPRFGQHGATGSW